MLGCGEPQHSLELLMFNFSSVSAPKSARTDQNHLLTKNSKGESLNPFDLTALLGALGQSVLVCVTNGAGQIVFVNEPLEKYSQYLMGELVDKNLQFLFADDQPAEVIQSMWQTIQSGKVWRGELKNKTKSGTFYWVDCYLVPVLDKHQKLTRIVSAAFIISDKKEVEANLQQQNESLEKTKLAVLNILEDLEKERQKLKQKDLELAEAEKVGKFGTFTWEIKTNQVTWSAGAFLVYELTPNPEGTPPSLENYFQLIHEHDREAARKSLQTALQAKTEQESKHRILKKDGSVHWIKVRSKMSFAEDGTPLVMQGSYQDVTKETEIDQTKTEFVSLASHQLRTPLTAINWYTEMLLGGDAGAVNDEQKDYLTQVAMASKRMVELVSALLNVSRIEMGTFAMEPEATDLHNLLTSVLQEISHEIQKKSLEIVDESDELPKISVDPKLMRIVYQNLLTNAVKYTPEKGKVTIKHRLITDEKIGEVVQLEVTDTGIGIPIDQQGKIFSKLFRAANAQLADSQGTGLGLYIVKAIVEEAGGKIQFTSQENHGTTFTIFLPKAGMPERAGSKALEVSLS